MNIERLKNQLRIDEGVENKIYFINNLPHLGVGHLITKDDPEYNLLPLLTKGSVSEVKITNKIVDEYFDKDVKIAIDSCKKVFDNWQSLPDEAQQIIANMMFNMGINRFKGFEQFIAAIKKQDYKEAAKEMEDSLWFKDKKRGVGKRAVRLRDRMLIVDHYI